MTDAGRRTLWGVIVAGLAAMAVAAPVKISARQLSESDGEGRPGASGGGTTVHMRGLQFSPGSLQVARGAKVVFDNDDVAPHTVTEDSGGTDSGVLPPGKSFELVIDKNLKYHCDIHPNMKASVEIAG